MKKNGKVCVSPENLPVENPGLIIESTDDKKIKLTVDEAVIEGGGGGGSFVLKLYYVEDDGKDLLYYDPEHTQVFFDGEIVIDNYDEALEAAQHYIDILNGYDGVLIIISYQDGYETYYEVRSCTGYSMQNNSQPGYEQVHVGMDPDGLDITLADYHTPY